MGNVEETLIWGCGMEETSVGIDVKYSSISYNPFFISLLINNITFKSKM